MHTPATAPIPSLAVSSALACLLAAPLAGQGRGRDYPPAAEPEHGSFTTDTFESKALGERAQYGIYLPESYDTEENADKSYPLVVWLHGMFEDHKRFHIRGGTTILDDMIAKGELPEMIFVTAYGGRSSFYVNGAGGAYEDMIAEDLLTHLLEEYRVDDRRERRALMGVSMGGYGALKIGLKHPELFGAVAAHSAALLPRDPDKLDETFPWLERWGGGQRALATVFGSPLDRDLWNEENLLLRAESLEAETLDGLAIYIDCGDADRYGFADPNEELHGLLEEREVPHTWRLVEGGNHGWRSNYNQQALPHSLAFIGASLTAKQGAAGLGGMLESSGGKDKATPDRSERAK